MNDNICYYIGRNGTHFNRAIKIDFSALSTYTYSNLDNSSYYYTSLDVVNENETIILSFKLTSFDHTIYKYNFNTNTVDWAVEAGSLGKKY